MAPRYRPPDEAARVRLSSTGSSGSESSPNASCRISSGRESSCSTRASAGQSPSGTSGLPAGAIPGDVAGSAALSSSLEDVLRPSLSRRRSSTFQSPTIGSMNCAARSRTKRPSVFTSILPRSTRLGPGPWSAGSPLPKLARSWSSSTHTAPEETLSRNNAAQLGRDIVRQ